ncbi:ribosome biogenesis regulatory protein, putative [Eimeria brunetti]|uniref:Ribosome biogenesis regulatory protein n=1 Tax=Eimeria brunetti TaxID=51314 RepID=U6LVF0_9EIME|nr:ribosome biogenesis regulatory protein, putative [Eimeria brunetti]
MESSGPVRVDLSSLGPGLSENVGAADPLSYHLHNLIATDLSPIEVTTDLEEKTRQAAEWFLPTARALTRWEAFALAKGIKKRKRSKLIWSEEHKTWLRRWGYNKGMYRPQQQQQHQPVLEEKGAVLLRSRNVKLKHAAAAFAAGGKGQKGKRRVATADPAAAAAAAGGFEDLFTKAKREHQLQQTKQKLRELRNAAEAKTGRAAARGVMTAAAAKPHSAAAAQALTLPAGVPVLSNKRHSGKNKHELQEILYR